MLEKYREAVNDVPDHLARLAVEQIALSTGWSLTFDRPLFDCLRRQSLSQADLVLALLRVGTREALDHAALIVGRPVAQCPPALARLSPDASRERTPLDRHVTATWEGSLPGEVRVGRTVQQMLSRGVPRRWLREAVAAHKIQLEFE